MNEILLKAIVKNKKDVDILADNIFYFLKQGYRQEGKLINISDLEEKFEGTNVVFQIFKK